jgi:hypothetical protein
MAVSIDDYFQRVQALHDTQERDGEAIGQRFAEQLSGDEASVEEIFAALETILPEILPEFEATLIATLNGLVQITPPPDLLDAHGDLIEAYDELIKVFGRGVEQLDDGQSPREALAALFSIDAGGELAQRFSKVADELAAAADAAGIEGFVGGGPLVVGATGPDGTVVVGRDAGDDEPRSTGMTGVRDVDAVI